MVFFVRTFDFRKYWLARNPMPHNKTSYTMGPSLLKGWQMLAEIVRMKPGNSVLTCSINCHIAFLETAWPID